eukprot:TRINITY_DN22317_c0_g1_i1.p1 TRINITY_DN22317_c0_g1~~TRINITY_DN22317_c0_g1_i1.p1  ORF type:complete len:425 (+),score=89.66 TRINITY_DN22317_c0_g1_i1:46-1320(+)
MMMLALSALVAASLPEDIAAILKPVAEETSQKYNCSISIAYYDSKGQSAAAAAGVIDRITNATAEVTDSFVWGSVTKTFTGSAVLKFVDEGKLSLDDKISPIINPFMMRANGTTLDYRFGDVINEVTVRQLLHMTSGVPDYDTTWLPGDPWRIRQYNNPLHDYGPIEIITDQSMNVPGVFPPGTKQYYSCTGYILLGLLLAELSGAETWQDFRQREVIPTFNDIIDDGVNISNIVFADSGPCSKYTRVHGYDEVQVKGFDVWNVSCLGGWTAGNVIGSPLEMAKWTQLMYGTPGSVISRSNEELLKNTSIACDIHTKGCAGIGPQGYGYSSFNQSLSTGRSGPVGESWGHLGATYGYQSSTNYYPKLNFTLAVASNIEIQEQDQPSYALCLAYNEILNYLEGKPKPTCNFTHSGYFFGHCDCTP